MKEMRPNIGWLARDSREERLFRSFICWLNRWHHSFALYWWSTRAEIFLGFCGDDAVLGGYAATRCCMIPPASTHWRWRSWPPRVGGAPATWLWETSLLGPGWACVGFGFGPGSTLARWRLVMSAAWHHGSACGSWIVLSSPVSAGSS
jgi:hypothetical protein